MPANFPRSLILLALAIFCLTVSPALDFVSGTNAAWAKGPKTKKVKAPKASKRPTLSYQPKAMHTPPKYALRVGILELRDRRASKFYDGTDEFFAEPLMDALSQASYYELKASRLFEAVIRIPGEADIKLTRKSVAALAERHDVDLIFVGDLINFNLLREKMRQSRKGADFMIKVRFAMVGQLIEAKSGTILWAESVSSEFSSLNTSGKFKAQDYGSSAQRAVQAGFADARKMISATGLGIRP